MAFGKLFLADPDPVQRRRERANFRPDKAAFYGGGARGYTGYPARSQ